MRRKKLRLLHIFAVAAAPRNKGGVALDASGNVVQVLIDAFSKI